MAACCRLKVWLYPKKSCVQTFSTLSGLLCTQQRSAVTTESHQQRSAPLAYGVQQQCPQLHFKARVSCMLLGCAGTELFADI
jgi:hypothetical protein